MGRNALCTCVRLDGVEFQGLIDTDSDVSLISNQYRSLFENKIESCASVIRGISSGTLEATEQLKLKVDITGVLVPDGILDFGF